VESNQSSGCTLDGCDLAVPTGVKTAKVVCNGVNWNWFFVCRVFLLPGNVFLFSFCPGGY